MPKLSIIVPTFNSSSCIERCLQSIRIQTFRDYEVILQDGASSDDTVRIARGFRDANPGIGIKIFSEKDTGPYDAMNKACRRGSGEWLYFLGSDDELHDENVLSTVMGSPGLAACDVVYGNVQVIGDAGWAKNGSVYDGMFDLRKLLIQNICHQAIFYRAAFLRRIGKYNTRYAVLADWDFNLRCWSKTEFRYLDTIVANFHAGGASGRAADERFGQEVALNVLRYFGLSIYDPLVNTPEFAGFADIIRMQQSPGFLRTLVSGIREVVRPRVERLGPAESGVSMNGDAENAVVRAIAFHLPQFHPIPENDEWWGKGFTEWTNVVRTKPRFAGHYQPHLPTDLGFYDLRLPEARAAQAQLAAEYGVYGFCYYHYWFNGRRLLERPVNDIWKSGEPDFPFCLCWANENWTRRWDGQNSEILLEQHYGFEDDLAHIRSLIPLFHDARYIRVMGKPMFLVYRASVLPEPKRTTEIWRREAERAGLKGLFLVRVESHDQAGADPRSLGFDYAVGFHPKYALVSASRILRRKWWHRRKLRTAEPEYYDNCISDYEKYVSGALAAPRPAYPWIPCVCPGWDNSARRKEHAYILANSTPETYGRWLREVVDRQKAGLKPEQEGQISPESLVFINAWNEWAEGNHLEPCERWGRKYLEATRSALEVPAQRNLEYAKR